MDGELETVGTFLWRGDAEIARARLTADGIKSFVAADDEGGLNPGFFNEFRVRLVVDVRDAAHARAVLDGDASPLPREMVEACVAHARFAYPEEACGLIAFDAAGDPRMVYCLTNIDRSPHRYTVDPTEHFRAMQHSARMGWEIGGAFHSHPTSSARPSRTDVAAALDPTWMYVIVGMAEPTTPDVRAYRITNGEVAEWGTSGAGVGDAAGN